MKHLNIFRYLLFFLPDRLTQLHERKGDAWEAKHFIGMAMKENVSSGLCIG